MKTILLSLFCLSTLGSISAVTVFAAGEPELDPAARRVEFKKDLFRPDPDYSERVYSPDEQLFIYGGKQKRSEPFYPLVFGPRMYGYGPVTEGFNLFGSRNLAFPRLMLFGDLRNVATYSQDANGKELGELNSRLNLDIDLNLTATERVHAFTRPLDQGGEFTGCIFGPNVQNKCNLRTDFNLDALFFEGDVGSIWGGISGKPNNIDLPFALGLMPFILHNGIWVNDIFQGASFAIPAMHSKWLNISNMDLTVFAAYKDVNSVVANPVKDDDVNIYGMNLFSEMWSGYLEAGYGYTDDQSAEDSDFHSYAVSFTHRWKNIASFSERVIGNFGQDAGKFNKKVTANGAVLLLESSWITKLPYTLVPYLNLFVGLDKPQGLAKQNGLLENVGILFEGDGVTKFPFLDNSGNNTFGGAAGIEYLFNLDKQLVFELATNQVLGGSFKANRKLKQDEYGAAVRFQLPLTKALIWRSDAMQAIRPDQRNVYGVRTELRLKF